ncbi:MAG: hypothetical protein U0939_11825 [Pirellulales bacterium]
MANPIYFDPRTLLKQLAIPLVQRLFEQRGELLDLPWSELRQKKQTAPIYAAWQRLPEDRRREIQIVFHEIAEAATELGIAAFAQEVKHAAPGDVWKFTACRSRLNKALWFYLSFPERFERATLFARADSLTTGRFAIRRDDLPRTPLNVTPEVLTALGEALRGFYWPTQMRGHHCHVEHHRRHDGDDYFFAYLDDWPDKRLAFGDNGKLRIHSARFAFSVLFVFSPSDGSLELVANGGESIHFPLQQAFCRSVLGIDIAPANPERPVYRLQQVLDPAFNYPTAAEDRICRVQLKSIRWKPAGEIKQLRATVQEFESTICRSEWLELVQRFLAGLGLAPTQAVVEGATFRLTLLRGGRSRVLEFTIALPSRCTVRTKSDELLAIGKRCLAQWGMINA